MSTFLVTGGAGFIGSHIVQHLDRDGHRVRVLDNISTGKRENLLKASEQVEIIEDDVCNVSAVRKAVKDVDYIIHLAAQVSVPLSIDDPATTEEINSQGTLNVLMAARDENVKRFVLASSCAVYGDNPNLPLHEDLRPAPLSPYAITKLAGEHYCQVFHGLYGLPTVALRFLNVFGPGQSSNSAYAAAIPKFFEAITNGHQPTVYGDGEQTRDFIYVENIVKANMLACTCKDAVGQVINIGSGIETSLNQLLKTIGKIAGYEAKPIYAPPRQGDIRNSVGDVTLARKLLGFECRIDLEEGLRKTWEYFTSLQNMYNNEA
jgi:UDP-glucose 4-epimerase